jgi:hypothetical protein
MSPIDKSDSILAALRTAIEADIHAARARAADLRVELAKITEPPTQPVMAFIAISIDRAYTALEAAFMRIARTVDEAVPTGESWHASLVHQMTLPIADRRAAVLSPESAASLEPLRRHRHWLRHAYAAEFDWKVMREVAATADAVIEAACTLLDQFVRTELTNNG